jgi:hypothetical protein
MTKKWLIYALGGGWGHLTRALALGRIAATERRVEIITNSPYAKQINHEGCLVHEISPQADFAQTCTTVQEIYHHNYYDCLIIDTFPRGLGGELADILPLMHHIPRILIHRDINPRYITLKKLRPFVVENFSLILVPGEGKDVPFCDLSCVQHTAPWLIRNFWELTPRVTIREKILRVNQSVKTILICASGKTSELSIFGRIAQRLHEEFPQYAVRILAANCPEECSKNLWVTHHPGIECLAAADIVVGGAGYNTVYECAAVGVPLVKLVFPRLYDRQAKRAGMGDWVRDVEEAIVTVSLMVEQVKVKTQLFMPSYVNGAVKAVQYIAATQ